MHCPRSIAQQQVSYRVSEVDSLRAIIQTQRQKPDTNLVKSYLQLSALLQSKSIQEAERWAKEAIAIAEKLKEPKFLGRSYTQLGVCYRLQSQYDRSYILQIQASPLLEKCNDKDGLSQTLKEIGVVHYYEQEYEKALEFFKKSLLLKKELKQNLSLSYNNIGAAYESLGQFAKAIEHYELALVYAATNDWKSIAYTKTNLSNALVKIKQYEKALRNATEALQMLEKLGDKQALAECFVNIGSIYLKMNQPRQAEAFLKEGLVLAEQMKLKNISIEAFRLLAEKEKKLKNFERALYYYSNYMTLKDSLYSKEKARELAKMQAKYHTLQTERENLKLKQHEIEQKNTITRQYYITLAISVVLLLVGIIAGLVFRNYQKGKRINQELERQKEEIQSQRDILESQHKALEEKNAQIQKSIQAALTIQQAALPDLEKFANFFSDFFVFFKPRDVVSGDFYWLERIDQTTIIAVADCTGHGVSGAFMSLIGKILLDKIILQEKILNPALILTKLHEEVQKSLRQKETHNQEGMDIALATFMPLPDQRVELHFAAARSSIYYTEQVNENSLEIMRLKGTKQSIGGIQNLRKPFENLTLVLPKKTIIYLSSDGYIDQNNKQQQKFGKENFRNLLAQICHLPLQEQQQRLQQVLETHQHNTPQRDDILVVGVQL